MTPTFDLRDTPDTDALAADVARRLAVGEVGILPTETVYGLMCLANHPAGQARIYAMKGRDEHKPFQMLFADLDELPALGVAPNPALAALAQAFWPGPLTVVTPHIDGSSIGLRMPDHPFVLRVLRHLRHPLSATSANPAGVDPAASAASGFTDLLAAPDFIVLGPCASGPASTVVRLTGESFQIIREGALSCQRIHAELVKIGMAETGLNL